MRVQPWQYRQDRCSAYPTVFILFYSYYYSYYCYYYYHYFTNPFYTFD